MFPSKKSFHEIKFWAFNIIFFNAHLGLKIFSELQKIRFSDQKNILRAHYQII